MLPVELEGAHIPRERVRTSTELSNERGDQGYLPAFWEVVSGPLGEESPHRAWSGQELLCGACASACCRDEAEKAVWFDTI